MHGADPHFCGFLSESVLASDELSAKLFSVQWMASLLLPIAVAMAPRTFSDPRAFSSSMLSGSVGKVLFVCCLSSVPSRVHSRFIWKECGKYVGADGNGALGHWLRVSCGWMTGAQTANYKPQTTNYGSQTTTTNIKQARNQRHTAQSSSMQCHMSIMDIV